MTTKTIDANEATIHHALATMVDQYPQLMTELADMVLARRNGMADLVADCADEICDLLESAFAEEGFAESFGEPAELLTAD